MFKNNLALPCWRVLVEISTGHKKQKGGDYLKRNGLLSVKIRKLYRDNNMTVPPLLVSLLAETDRIQKVQDRLWEIIEAEPLLTEYTNKADATNTTASAALKELRSWQLVYQGACRSIHKILQLDFASLEDLDNELDEFV